MSAWRSFLGTLLALVVANGTLWLVLAGNLNAGVYSPDADSLGIPLIEAALASGLILLALGISVALPRSSRIWVILRTVLAVLAASQSLVLSLSWFIPNHYPASLAFSVVVLVIIGSWWFGRKVPDPIGRNSRPP